MLLLVNSLLVVYIIPTDYWIVNPYIDTIVLVIGCVFNCIYYKIKCRDIGLVKFSVMEVINTLLSLSVIFVAFQLTPNISISLYNH